MKRFALVSGLALVLMCSALGSYPAGAEDRPGAHEPQTGAIGGICHVDSRVNAYVDVYINGVYRGTMAPFGDIYPFVGELPGQVTTLYAVSRDGRTWRLTLTGYYDNYQWILF